MTSFQLKQEIESLRNTDIPVLVRDQKGSTFPVAGVQTDLDVNDTELAFVLRIQTPEQPDLYRKEDVLPIVKAVRRSLEWFLDSSKPNPLAALTMALEHAKDLGLEDK